MKKYHSDHYRPTEDEEYMCKNHREYFKQKLLARRKELLAMSELFLVELKENGIKAADILDQSSHHTEMFLDFSTSQRQQNVLNEIDLALVRIETGEYGFCEITGEEIGLKRLAAQPLATRCVEAQKLFERSMKMKARIEAVSPHFPKRCSY
jgi:RNA polymerase-binding transcription factor